MFTRHPRDFSKNYAHSVNTKQDTVIYLTYSFDLDLNHTHPQVALCGTTMLHGYRLLFRSEPDCYALATIEPAIGSSVPVALWRIPAVHETYLDRDCPTMYHKKRLEAYLSGKPVLCFTYVMNDGYDLWRPSLEYFKMLLDRYVELGFCVQPLREAYDIAHWAMMEKLEKGAAAEGWDAPYHT
jgi:hypothetical protein